MTSLITIISLALTRMHSSEDQALQNTPPQHAPTACAQQQRTSVRPSGPKDPCKTGKSAAPSSGTEPPARRKRQRRSRSKKPNKSPSVALTYPQLPAVYELRRKQCPRRTPPTQRRRSLPLCRWGHLLQLGYSHQRLDLQARPGLHVSQNFWKSS